MKAVRSLKRMSTLRTEKRVTITRFAVAGRQLTVIMKADGFTCITPSHERSRSGFDGEKRNTMLDVEGYSQKLIGECKKRVRRTIA